MKNKTKKQHFIKICPKCGSIDVQTDFSNPADWAFGITPRYECNSCGYKSTVLPEILVEDIENYKKEKNKHS